MKTKAPTNSVAKGFLNELQVNINKAEDNVNSTTNTTNIQGVVSCQGSIEIKPDTVNDVLNWVNNNPDDVVLPGWTNKVELLDDSDRIAVMMAIKIRSKVNLTLLKKQLNNAIKVWDQVAIKKKNQQISFIRQKKQIVEIEYAPAKTRDVTLDAAMAIVNDPYRGMVFRYGNTLVSIQVEQPTTVRGLYQLNCNNINYPKMPVVKGYDTITLRHRLEQSAVYIVKDDESGNTSKPWPNDIIDGLFSQTEVKFPTLTGIIPHPLVGSDGKLITKQGYDRSTGLYVEYDDDINKKLITSPTIKDVKDELEFLCDKVFADFPFAEDIDKISAVAVLLSAIQRKLITGDSGCPGFIIVAPIQASGKTTIVQIISYSVYGRPVAVSSWSDSDTEMAKLILSILLEGHGCVLFDNLPSGSSLSSNALARAMTGNSYSGRVLGRNKTAIVPSNVLWLFTGNNVSICGDFNTRVIPIRLDSRCADPDQRTFTRPDIGEWCLNHRAEIIKACLAIVMADCSQLSKDIKPTRYPDWDKYVRLPLLAASGIDVADKFQHNKQSDPEIEIRLNFLNALFAVFGSKSVTANEIIRVAAAAENDIHLFMGDIFPAGSPSAHQLGKWLGGIKNQILGEYQLTSSTGTNGESKNRTIWTVEKISLLVP